MSLDIKEAFKRATVGSTVTFAIDDDNGSKLTYEVLLLKGPEEENSDIENLKKLSLEEIKNVLAKTVVKYDDSDDPVFPEEDWEIYK